ncbi:putative CRISPR-associated protein [Thermogutta sp.]|uniref:putative CRISPR-associated protein n=1 Tax=Thermogutta sp. TaxID=1962930 RepID=UPI00321FA1A8
MRRVICTTGTSILTNQKRSAGNQELPPGAQNLKQWLKQFKTTFSDREQFLSKLCAETHSLLRLGLERSDQVVLLHTETSDGRVAAEAVRDVIRDEFGVDVWLREVEGLQVSDATRFRRVGLHKLFEILRKESVEWQQEAPEEREEVILNATGGFKAVVPYLTLFGVIHRLDVVYIFEQSNSLIRLPPLPIHFDYERLGQARSALQLLKKEGALPREKFFEQIRGLPYQERRRYECLLEEEESSGLVTLSSFGFLVLDALEKDTKQVYLSPQAREAYNASQGEVRKRLVRFLSGLQDPLYRDSHKHTVESTDLTVYKLGHQAERAAGFVRGNRLYIALLYTSHDEYERDIKNHSVAEFEGRLRGFVPWTPPAEEYVPPTEIPDE